jgi:hypothetical protein
MNPLRSVLWAAATTAIVLVVGGSVCGFAQEPAAAYGSRLPPLSPGEGGDVMVTAPADLCLDDSHELQIRRYVQDEAGFGMLYVLREPAGPSPCQWDVTGLRSGNYDAVIRRRRDDQIVATAPKTDVKVGALGELLVEFAEVAVGGIISINGQPPANLQLFVQAGEGMNSWRVPLQEDGSYSVTLTGSDPKSTFCIWLESATSQHIGMFHLGCQPFAPGLNRWDTDVHLPPGVIRVDVTPFGNPVSNDWTSLVVVINGTRSWSSDGFKATAGFHGEYVGGEFGEYHVSIQTGPDHRILSTFDVVLSGDSPIGQVRLAVPIGALRCNDGWWSAC